MFGAADIASFVCRACLFLPPYPPTAKMPHWEFTAMRSDGVQVSFHPPGRGGKLTWATSGDEERAAALAAVKRKGVSEKVRACYLGPARVNLQQPTHSYYPVPITLQGGFRITFRLRWRLSHRLRVSQITSRASCSIRARPLSIFCGHASLWRSIIGCFILRADARRTEPK